MMSKDQACLHGQGKQDIRATFKQLQQSAGALEVVTYEGQRRKIGGPAISAASLAAADIVLTTYDVLARDLHHQPDLEERSYALRRQKKYEV